MLFFSALSGYIVWGILISSIWIFSFVLWKKQNKVVTNDLMEHAQSHHLEQEKYLESVLATIRMHRHNLMNDLQLLLGYVQLKKLDKAQKCAEYIQAKAVQEGVLFQCGVPKLILFLYGLQANYQNVELELQPSLNLDRLFSNAEACGMLIEKIAKLFCEHTQLEHEENKLILEMYLKNDLLHVHFIYNGRYDRGCLQQNYAKMKATEAKQEVDLTLSMKEGAEEIEITALFKTNADQM